MPCLRDGLAHHLALAPIARPSPRTSPYTGPARAPITSNWALHWTGPARAPITSHWALHWPRSRAHHLKLAHTLAPLARLRQGTRLPTQELEDWVDDAEEEHSTLGSPCSQGFGSPEGSARAKDASRSTGGSGGSGSRAALGHRMKSDSTICAAAILDEVPAPSPRAPPRHLDQVVPTLPAPPRDPAAAKVGNLVWVDDETAEPRGTESRRHAKLKPDDFD